MRNLLLLCLLTELLKKNNRCEGFHLYQVTTCPTRRPTSFPSQRRFFCADVTCQAQQQNSLQSRYSNGGNGRKYTTTPPKNVVDLVIRRILTTLQTFWWRSRKFIRSIVEGTTIYVLECENDKYYVGSTTNKKQRFKHQFGPRGGSKWTKMHRPIRVLKEYKRVPKIYTLGMEAQVTAEYMLKFGINNVRGAMFSHPFPYTMDNLDALTGFLGHYNEIIYKEIAVTLEATLPPALVPTEVERSQPTKAYKRRKKNKKRKKRTETNEA